jgi:preprotein translocase subunit YajC
MYQALTVFAEDPPKPGADPFSTPLFLILGVFALFYLVVLWPMKRRQDRERTALLTNLKKGDRVLTTAGIYGTVVGVSDKEDEVTVKVDDNTRLKMVKSSIGRNLSGEEAARAAKDKDKDKDKDKAGGTA